MSSDVQVILTGFTEEMARTLLKKVQDFPRENITAEEYAGLANGVALEEIKKENEALKKEVERLAAKNEHLSGNSVCIRRCHHGNPLNWTCRDCMKDHEME